MSSNKGLKTVRGFQSLGQYLMLLKRRTQLTICKKKDFKISIQSSISTLGPFPKVRASEFRKHKITFELHFNLFTLQMKIEMLSFKLSESNSIPCLPFTSQFGAVNACPIYTLLNNVKSSRVSYEYSNLIKNQA